MSSPRSFVLLFTGPSGAGKSSVIRPMVDADERLVFSVSCTTRAPRAGERDGVDYHFLDRPAFEQQIEADAFAEWAEVHGQLYGTRRADVQAELEAGRIPVLDVDVQGGLQLLPRYGDDLVSVFLFPPSWEELERRLRAHATETEESLALRLRNARHEVREADHYAYWIVNERIEASQGILRGILTAEAARRGRFVQAPLSD